jgi:hypothetical protein
MGVYANGHIIFGFVHDDDTGDLFAAIKNSAPDGIDEGFSIEELHQDLQAEHHVSLFQIGYEGVDVFSAFSANASAKGMDIQSIKAEDLAKTEEYASNIAAFLQALDIDPAKYTPGWYILGYMD